MTMLDDETLSALLHELGDSFAVPPSGVADTLRRVRQSDDANDQNDAVLNGHAVTTVREDVGERDAEEEELASRTIRRVIRTHRWLAVAASLIVLLALAGGAVLLGTSSSAPKITTASGDRPAPARHPACAEPEEGSVGHRRQCESPPPRRRRRPVRRRRAGRRAGRRQPRFRPARSDSRRGLSRPAHSISPWLKGR